MKSVAKLDIYITSSMQRHLGMRTPFKSYPLLQAHIKFSIEYAEHFYTNFCCLGAPSDDF